jgi:hypothetical protein
MDTRDLNQERQKIPQSIRLDARFLELQQIVMNSMSHRL